MGGNWRSQPRLPSRDIRIWDKVRVVARLKLVEMAAGSYQNLGTHGDYTVVFGNGHVSVA